ncbi:MAG: dihydrodipicolinate synthase family protein [Thermomicrobiales bacterium]|nr:dihydrodipicolinate synthase family protein [Thermomicrobiales bacterium]
MSLDWLRGVWAAIPTPWTADGRVDAGVVRALVDRYAAAGLNGAYTTGTDGEMHVLELDDFKALVDAFADATSANRLPAQIGCTWHHTEGVIERARYARERGIPRVQIALPGWVPLNDAEMLDFFAAIQAALPDVDVIHYNIATCGRFLTGSDYRKILEVTPNLRGSKHTGGNVGSLIDIVGATPGLHHFVVDTQIVPGALFGALGFYSFIANLAPNFATALWRDCENGDWEAAAAKRVRVDAFFAAWRAHWSGVSASPALGKIATAAFLLPEMPLAVRAPYRAGDQSHVTALRHLLETDFPELLA